MAQDATAGRLHNGKVAASSITVLDNRVPEPGSLAPAGLALAGLVVTGRRTKVRGTLQCDVAVGASPAIEL